MAGPPTNQNLSTADASMVLLLDARYPNHRAHARLASFVGEHRTHQRLTIDLVGLGTTRRRDVAIEEASTTWLSVPCLQDSMDPKAVETRLSSDGQFCRAGVPHGQWKTTTFTGALRLTGMTAPFVYDGAMNGNVFLAYVEQCWSRHCRRVT